MVTGVPGPGSNGEEDGDLGGVGGVAGATGAVLEEHEVDEVAQDPNQVGNGHSHRSSHRTQGRFADTVCHLHWLPHSLHVDGLAFEVIPLALRCGACAYDSRTARKDMHPPSRTLANTFS